LVLAKIPAHLCMRAPPKTSCGLELNKIPAVFVAKAPTITR
jgi:hypothetical protein